MSIILINFITHIVHGPVVFFLFFGGVDGVSVLGGLSTLLFWKGIGEKKGGKKSTEWDPADICTFLKVESFASLESLFKGYC